jgi:hypothetical protein
LNARQKNKRLKMQIDKLQSDNYLMKHIISDSPEMLRLYDLYNKPMNITSSPLQFKEYRSKAYIDSSMLYDENYITSLKHELSQELSDASKDYVTYKIDIYSLTITASLFVGMR